MAKAVRAVEAIRAGANLHDGGQGQSSEGCGVRSGSDIPDYQTYLTLAWLRSIDLITQHGRQGYSLPGDSKLERESERLWGQLTAR